MGDLDAKSENFSPSYVCHIFVRKVVISIYYAGKIMSALICG